MMQAARVIHRADWQSCLTLMRKIGGKENEDRGHGAKRHRVWQSLSLSKQRRDRRKKVGRKDDDEACENGADNMKKKEEKT